MEMFRYPDNSIVAANLKRLRINNGYTIKDIAEYLGLGSVQAVYKYEYGDSYIPGDRLLALMELYNADYRDLTTDHLEEDDMSSSHFLSIFKELNYELNDIFCIPC